MKAADGSLFEGASGVRNFSPYLREKNPVCDYLDPVKESWALVCVGFDYE